jgi:dTDP-4-dehydrorhamnose 3,5-epimerase
MLRVDDPWFERFGEIYFSSINRAAFKGWHKHLESVANYAVPFGDVKVSLYDGRQGSDTYGNSMVVGIGPNYQLLTVPNHIWVAFEGMYSPYSVIANCSTKAFDGSKVDHIEKGYEPWLA